MATLARLELNISECLNISSEKKNSEKLHFFTQVRNLFIKNIYHGKKVGVDGMILDVMRSRDSGTAPYIDYYPMCVSVQIKCWTDLEPYFEKKHFQLLMKMYANVKDIDLMIGILLEKRYGNEMGKIGGCLVAEQFNRFKYGDRYFYSNSNNPHKFSKGSLSLKSVLKISLFLLLLQFL